MKSFRIFISSPGDVAEERMLARRVIESLQSEHPELRLLPVLWEDLPLPATASFQQTIDIVIKEFQIDIAIFILWSRLGSPLGPPSRPDGQPYRSGTEREFDLMLQAYEQSGGIRPRILAYTRDDDETFSELLDGRKSDDSLEKLLEQRKMARSFIREHFHDTEGRNLRAYHIYAQPVSFAQRLHTHLRTVLDELLAAGDSPTRWRDAPYRSLEVFDIQHSLIFRGREEETCDLLQRLRDQRDSGTAFVVIVGASGSGKSSLARAGVAATLLYRSFDEAVQWRVSVLVPSLAKPGGYAGLAHAVQESLQEYLGVDEAWTAKLAKRLEENLEAATDLLDIAFKQACEKAGTTVRMLLVLDQMEELWTDRSLVPDERETFLLAIEALARSGHVAVLATLRSDFYAQAQVSESFRRMKGTAGHFDLAAPGTLALQRLITEPAKLAGLTFETDAASGRTLDARVLHDAESNKGALPLLQYALSELYQNRQGNLLTIAAYEEMGGVEGALGKRATAVFDALPQDAQDALEKILPQLISVPTGDSQNAAIRRASFDALTSMPACRQLVEALIEARFLTSDKQGGHAVVSLAHEALLRRWGKITDWLDSNRDLLRMRARVEQYEALWEESGGERSRLLPAGLPLAEAEKLAAEHSELLDSETIDFVKASSRQARWKRNVLIGVLSALTVLSLVAAVVALNFKKTADGNTAIANLSKQVADDKTKEATSALNDARKAQQQEQQTRYEIYKAAYASAHREGRSNEAALWMAAAIDLGSQIHLSATDDRLGLVGELGRATLQNWHGDAPTRLRQVWQKSDASTVWVLDDSNRFQTGKHQPDDGWVFEPALPELRNCSKAFELGDDLVVVADRKLRRVNRNAVSTSPLLPASDPFVQQALFATGSPTVIYFMQDLTLHCYQPASGEESKVVDLEGDASCRFDDLWLDATAQRAVFHGNKGEDHRLWVYDLSNGHRLLDIPCRKSNVSFASAGPIILHCGTTTTSELIGIDLREPEKYWHREMPWAAAQVMESGTGGFTLAHEDGHVRRWSLDGRLLETKNCPIGADADFRIHPVSDGFWTDVAGEIRRYSSLDQSLPKASNSVTRVRSMVACDEGRFIVSDGRHLELRALADNHIITTKNIPADQLECQPSSGKIFVRKGTELARYDLSTFTKDATLLGVEASDIVVMPDHGGIVSTSDDGVVLHLMDQSGPSQVLLARNADLLARVDNDRIIAIERDDALGALRVWHYDFTQGLATQIAVLECETNNLTAMAFDSKGQRLFTGHEDGEIVLYPIDLDIEGDAQASAENTRVVVSPAGHEKVTALWCLSDGRLAAARNGGALERYESQDDTRFTFSELLVPFDGAEVAILQEPAPGKLLLASTTGRHLLLEVKDTIAACGAIDAGVWSARACRCEHYSATPSGKTVQLTHGNEKPVSLQPTKVTNLDMQWSLINPSETLLAAADAEGGLHIWPLGNEATALPQCIDGAAPMQASYQVFTFIDDHTLLLVIGATACAVEVSADKEPALLWRRRVAVPGSFHTKHAAVAGGQFVVGDETQARVLITTFAPSGEVIEKPLPEVPRSLCFAGALNEWLIVGGEGNVFALSTANWKPVWKMALPEQLGRSSHYAVRSTCSIGGDLIAIGGKNVIWLARIGADKPFMELPATDYVWTLRYTASARRLDWAGNASAGAYTLPDFNAPAPTTEQVQSLLGSALSNGTTLVPWQPVHVKPHAKEAAQ